MQVFEISIKYGGYPVLNRRDMEKLINFLS